MKDLWLLFTFCVLILGIAAVSMTREKAAKSKIDREIKNRWLEESGLHSKLTQKLGDEEISKLKNGPLVPSEAVRIEGKTAKALSQYRAGQVWIEPVTGMAFVWVPGGCYQMGCGSWTSECDDDEKPVHEVCVDGFWMGKTEVTQGQWKKVMGDNPASFQKGDDYPVERVAWNDTKVFAEYLAAKNSDKYFFRLPTEAEWEYACRSGGKPEIYAGGSLVEDVAWYADNSQKMTHPVGTKKPNGLGLFDMSGNVYEWCEDIYSEKAYENHSQNNPSYTGGESRRVGRGGSWRYVAWDVRCSFRSFCSPGLRFYHLGFRLVRTGKLSP